jgi:dipeptidyl aminopeptidase/acylaminoacyl peptidase
MRPDDLLRITFLSDPQISPLGDRIAYVATTLSEERDEYLSSIWVIGGRGGSPRAAWGGSPRAAWGGSPRAAWGGQPRRFTAGPKRDTSPRWSPDGRWLAFLSEREQQERPQLYVIPADGGEPVRLTDLKNGVADPAWSADGRRLAFVSGVGGEDEPTGEEERRKSRPARVITTLKYRLNGEGFVYDRRPHVFVVALPGAHAAGRASEPKQITDGDFADADPTWSPDGGLIVFASARHENRDRDDAADLWAVPPEGGEPRRLTDTRGPVRRPDVAPDGRLVAYLGHDHKDDTAGRNTQLHVVPLDGGSPRCLTARLDRNCGGQAAAIAPRWTPDARSLLVAAEDQGDLAVVRVGLDEGQADFARVLGGQRQVTGFTLSADGARIAFAATTPTMPAELFVASADGSDERRVTDVNRAWRRQVALSPPERFRFERAGCRVDGWVMRPFGCQPGRRYPALLTIHGGPATQYGHGFFDEFQVYAGAGYAVLYTNPRGSQGYGEAFARAVIDDWGGGDYADVMAGLDEALRRFDFIDPARLGVMGGSYGGYMTSWTVGHTDRFRAACSERALNDWVSFFGTADIGHSFGEKYLSASPLDEGGVERLARHSPLTYARDIKTPLLIMHSDDDLRCPIEQAERLYVALKKLRREVLYVRFPQENHDLSRSGKPRHRLERFRYILEWFGKYLTPVG